MTREPKDHAPSWAVMGTVFGLGMMICLGLQAFDGRLLMGEAVWLKPTKFFLSLSVFAFTAIWLETYVTAEQAKRFRLPLMRWGVFFAASFEMVWICYQAARGRPSHYNTLSLFEMLMYALMGVGAVSLVLTRLPLALAICSSLKTRGGKEAVMVVVGVFLTLVLGIGVGGYISALPGHTIGAFGNPLPVLGWNGVGGDLRPAHFVSLHAEQVGLVSAVLSRGLGPMGRGLVLVGFVLGVVGASLGLLFLGLSGHSLTTLWG